MATSCILRAVTQSTKCVLGVVQRESSYAKCLPGISVSHNWVMSRSYSSFVSRLTADQLWESLTSVSNPGRKRGRGRNLKKKVDLNRHQQIGKGRSGIVFPGLSGPAMVGTKRTTVHQVETKPEDFIPKPTLKKRFPRIPALQRGYSGRKFPGVSIGPPDPINDYVFEGFDSRVLEYKMVSHMTGNLGRKMRFSALVVTGNGNGLGGFAVAKAAVGKTALRKAKNMAAQRLQFFERFNDHTIFHDFAVKEHKTTLFARRMPQGYGLVCHRVLKTICQVVGIKDIYVKTEGRTGNIQNVTKAFFRGLMEQETHQQLADRMKLNVVEYRSEMENFPIPVGTPRQGFSRTDPIKDEAFEYDNLYYKDGKIPLKRIKDPLHCHKSSPIAWKFYLLRNRDRNQLEAKYLRILYGLQPSREELRFRQKPLK